MENVILSSFVKETIHLVFFGFMCDCWLHLPILSISDNKQKPQMQQFGFA